MSYICSYCKTGVMNTPEQYQTHINGSKHKKKAFQLQAPDSGIEYDEFKPAKTVKNVAPFQEKDEDFPTLTNGKSTNGTNILAYSNIKNNLVSGNRPIVVYEDPVHHEDCIEVDDFRTVDEVFYNENSKIESARYIVSSYIKNQKTAAQALNEIAKAMVWELEFEPVHSKNLRYAMAVLISGNQFAVGEGENKKDAKQNAAAEAISEIKIRLKRRNKTDPVPVTTSVTKTKVFAQCSDESAADCYRKIAITKYEELVDSYSRRTSSMPKRYAAFIITERFDQHAKEGSVVAFGAGKGVKKSDDITENQGYHIKNFDAIVIAKRSLQCFFYNQILLLLDKKRSNLKGEKVYFEVGKNGYATLKQGCRLHLYMSHAPKGDCVESIPRNWEEPLRLPTKEMDRDKCGILDPIMYMSYSQNALLKEPGHIRVLRPDSEDEWISLVTYRSKNKLNRNVTMSPTDKLMSWIHLGIQGALLSHLMNPVYLYSIQFGKDYMHEHISRALLCRVPLENIISNRGSYYDPIKYFDPYLERVTELNSDQINSLDYDNSKVCFNWYMNPATELPEIIDVRTGCVHHSSPYELPGGDENNKCSRLSKVCMLLRLKESINAAIDYFAMRPEYQRTSKALLYPVPNPNSRLVSIYSGKYKTKLELLNNFPGSLEITSLEYCKVLQKIGYLQGINGACKYDYNSFKTSAVDYRRLKQCLFESLLNKHYGEWVPNVERNKFNLTELYDI